MIFFWEKKNFGDNLSEKNDAIYKFTNKITLIAIGNWIHGWVQKILKGTIESNLPSLVKKELYFPKPIIQSTSC